MTEKDAVRARAVAPPAALYLPVDAELPARFVDQVVKRVRSLRSSLDAEGDHD